MNSRKRIEAKIKYVFATEAETGEKFRCAMCCERLEEGYCLDPETDEEYEILVQKSDDPPELDSRRMLLWRLLRFSSRFDSHTFLRETHQDTQA
jgi:hypothetical protein